MNGQIDGTRRTELILAATADALRVVEDQRFFKTERGYQGAFYSALQRALDTQGDSVQEKAVLEMEYQKSIRHGVTQRPDIIFHVPEENTGAPVTANNLAVWALKRRASASKALMDYAKLDQMCEKLRYPLGVFINIDSHQHHLEAYTGSNRCRIHAFAVTLEQRSVRILHAWWEGQGLVVKEV